MAVDGSRFVLHYLTEAPVVGVKTILKVYKSDEGQAPVEIVCSSCAEANDRALEPEFAKFLSWPNNLLPWVSNSSLSKLLIPTKEGLYVHDVFENRVVAILGKGLPFFLGETSAVTQATDGKLWLWQFAR